MKIFDAPVFRRFWYPVMAQERLVRGPQAFSFFEEDMVVWQGTDGVVSALADRCGHEGVRLSPGEVCGHHLVCPHHHWEFAADGRCVRIPQKPGVVPGPRSRVRAYRATGRYGLAWLAVEEPLAPIPEVPELESPDFRVIPTLQDRRRVSAFRVMEAWLDPRLEGARVTSVEQGSFGAEARFVVAAPDGTLAGRITWATPAVRILRLTYPSGLQRVLLATVAPLADRWSIVSRTEARNDTEADRPAGEVVAADRLTAAAEFSALEVMGPDVPLLPGEGAEELAPEDARLPARKTLRRILEAQG